MISKDDLIKHGKKESLDYNDRAEEAIYLDGFIDALKLLYPLVEAIYNCKEDRHYYGTFQRHTDVIKEIERKVKGNE